MASKSKQNEPDLSFLYQGSSVLVLTANSLAGRDWMKENVQAESWQYVGTGIAVEPRFAAGIAQGAADDGLVVE